MRKRERRIIRFSVQSLFTLLVLLLPLNLYRQVKSEERHVYLLKQDIAALSANKSQALPSEEEYSDLLNQYGGLVASRPPDVSLFFHELAESLGEGVTLDNLVLKNNSFQLKGEAENPLGRMESFRENGSFSKVLPYQIKPVEGSVKQSFFIDGSI